MKFFLIVALLFVPSPQEPTLEETAKWLQENLPTRAIYAGTSGKYSRSSRVVSAKIANCTCKLKVVEEGLLAGAKIYDFSLKSLDPEKLKIAEGLWDDYKPAPAVLMFPTKNGANLIAFEDESLHAGMTSSFYLMINDKETAERIKKAFAHLIKLCQIEKKEPF